MDKKFVLGLVTGFSLAALSIIAYIPELADALYSIPPTQAWRTIGVDNTPATTNSTSTELSAINYRDQLYLLSDGSVLFNITTYP